MSEDKYAGLKAFTNPFIFGCAMWLVYLVQVVTRVDFHELGILPRTAEGLVGILTSPFVHSDLNHITSNTIPFLVVGTVLFYFYNTIAWRVLSMIYLFTGFWVWMAARPNYHIGASGLIYGLVCFMFFSGMIRKDRRLLAISLLVTFLYGSLVWGILPVDQSVSWESHLFGSAAGIFAAFYFRKEGPEKEKYSWELEEETEEETAVAPDEQGQDRGQGSSTTHHGGGIIIQYDFKEKSPEDEKKEES